MYCVIYSTYRYYYDILFADPPSEDEIIVISRPVLPKTRKYRLDMGGPIHTIERIPSPPNYLSKTIKSRKRESRWGQHDGVAPPLHRDYFSHPTFANAPYPPELYFNYEPVRRMHDPGQSENPVNAYEVVHPMDPIHSKMANPKFQRM